jgi:hypothetical protein
MKSLNLAALLLLSACTTTPAVAPSASPSPQGSASSSPVASSSPANTSNSTSASGGVLKYLGKIADKASPSYAGGADGTPDYVFSYNYDFGKEVTVKSLILSRIENGKPMGQAGWATSAGKYWLIHVSANGRDLNEGAPKPTLGNVSGQVEFVMTGASLDPGLFSTGTVYELLVTYLDGGTEKTVTSRVTM